MPQYDLKAQRVREIADVDVQQLQQRFMTTAALLSEEIYQQYRHPQEAFVADRMKDNEYYHNAQFTQEQVDKLAFRAQAAVPINVIKPAVEQAVGMLTTRSPRFHATAREDSDVKTARVISNLLTYIWDISGGNSHLKRAVRDYYVKGRGVLLARVDPNGDYGRGEIKIESADPFQVYPDPNSQDVLWRDAANIIVRYVMTAERIEQIWPDAFESGLMNVAAQVGGNTLPETSMAHQQGQQVGVIEEPDAYHERYEILERYAKVKVRYRHIEDSVSGSEFVFLDDEYEEYIRRAAFHVSQEDGSEFYVTEGSDLESMLQMWQAATPDPKNPNIRIFETEQGGALAITATTIGTLISEGLIKVRSVLLDRVQLVITIGGMEYANLNMPISEYPIIPLNNHHDRNPYSLSDITFVRPMQDVLNKLNMQILSNLATSSNQKIIVERGSIDRKDVERQIAKSGPAVIEVGAGSFEPKILGTGQIPNGLFQYFGEIKASIQEVLGIFAMQGGEPTSAPETYKGTIALDEFGQRRIKSKLDDIEFALSALGAVVVQLLPSVYRQEKMIRIVQPNGTVDESVANQLVYDDFTDEIKRINDLGVGQFDTKVVSGSTLPSHRWAEEEYLTRLYELNLIDQVEVLKHSELVDIEGVLARSSQIAQLTQQVQQLQEELKRAKAMEQSAITNELTAKKQAHIDKFKADVKGKGLEISAAAQIAQARIKDYVAQQKPTTNAN